MKIIDITQELFTCRVYPGDKQPVYEQVRTIEHDKCNLTNFSMCVHNGTHIDAPKHFIANGKGVDELDLYAFYGECTVIEFNGVIGEKEAACMLKNCRERLLIKGDCEFSDDGADKIANSHIRLLGVENQSVGNIEHPMSVHIILLKKEIVLLEGLDLSGAEAGEYLLSAFPLNLRGADGAPVRAVLIC